MDNGHHPDQTRPGAGAARVSRAVSDIVHQYNAGRLRTSTSICRRRAAPLPVLLSRHCLFASDAIEQRCGSVELDALVTG